MAISWLATAAVLLLASDASAQAGSRLAAGVSYRSAKDNCPKQCSETGPDTFDWPVFRSVDQLARCEQSMLYGFNLNDRVDERESNHRIYACTAYGKDWDNNKTLKIGAPTPQATDVNVTYTMGWDSSIEGMSEAGYNAVISQVRSYMTEGQGQAQSNRSTILFARFGQTTAGLYVGNGLLSSQVSDVALNALAAETHLFKGQRSSLSMQLCGPKYDGQHVFGFMAVNNGTFGAIQDAITAWSEGTCLEFEKTTNFTSTASFVSPLLADIKANNATIAAGSNSTASRRSWMRNVISARGECRTVQVDFGDDCGKLAQKCGISGPDFEKYNSAKGFCSSLKPQQHVCCSAGDLPNFRPKPNSDGSCATVIVHKDESCSSIGAANSLTNDEIESFNKKTWGWNGCKNVWAGSVMCVSKGSPPMPSVVDNAVCGPQVPGTKEPADKDKLAALNPCPLNACCDIFGQCGTTDEFCKDTNTGAPGTAKPGTYGCISNCGTDIIKSGASEFRKIGYFEGFNFGRKCLYQDALQIDGSQYTHLHFGFGDISHDYKISAGDQMATYQFNNFRYIEGPKKIISFGGWEFSNGPDTYTIFREGTKPANRMQLASAIADFVNAQGLDGVDIDWEYPGAPDIPGVPPGAKDEGANYLAFLALLKNKLNGKSLSIAAPASYWYLKQFPIDKISKIVDYIVYMTYDLHGQWDADNSYAQLGCPSGKCLRSDVNLTETMNSLSMITKAGAASGKVVVGVTSYGRSFAMAQSGCYTPDCQYTGSRGESDAKKGKCTDTAGYISNAEILDIIKNEPNRVNQNYIDKGSHSNILVYDDTQWVGYMTSDIRNIRSKMYQSLQMGGTTNWATDLETFNDPPTGVRDWASFKLQVKAGTNPLHAGGRNGNWTQLKCDSAPYTEIYDYSPKERWEKLDGKDAWMDIVNDWKDHKKDQPNDKNFIRFVAYLVGGPTRADCGDIQSANGCHDYRDCKEFSNDKSGPAAALIWNSFVAISSLFSKYHESLVTVSALLIDNSLDDFEQTFAPVPPPKDDTWISVLLNIVSMGTPFVGGKFFTNFLSKLPALAKQSEETLAKSKELTTTLMSGAVTLAGTLRPKGDVDDWTDAATKKFSHYIGQSLYVWDNVTANSLHDLFDGSDESLDKLTTLLADGNFIDGSGETAELPASDKNTVESAFLKAFYGFAIPTIWRKSGHRPFIIDTGKDCKDDGDLPQSKLKGACIDGKAYQLGDPDGTSVTCPGCDHGTNHIPSAFSNLAGDGELKDGNWGGVTAQDIIRGAVATYKQNGGSNGGGIANAEDKGTFDSLVRQDITTPGYIRLPVCSETLARRSWDSADDTKSLRDDDQYPCSVNNGKDYCGDSSFENQTTDASPLVEDCLQIVKNIQGTDGSWNTFIEQQRAIVHAGTCKLGVTGKGRKGNSNFDVGAQDVVDIIKESVDKFQFNGKVGAKGSMSCHGNIKGQDVDWAIYHS